MPGSLNWRGWGTEESLLPCAAVRDEFEDVGARAGGEVEGAHGRWWEGVGGKKKLEVVSEEALVGVMNSWRGPCWVGVWSSMVGQGWGARCYDSHQRVTLQFSTIPVPMYTRFTPWTHCFNMRKFTYSQRRSVNPTILKKRSVQNTWPRKTSVLPIN